MRRRILVVDDEPGMLRAVQRILESGYDVATASSPEQARATAAGFRPDLAILDIRMPGGDGFDLMSALKAQRPDLDVILMTGSVGEPDQKLIRAIRQKAFYFIQKPFDREVLRTLVERCLELRRLEEQDRRHLQRLEGELAQARAFQSSLLPPPESTEGRIALHALYVPCAELGGDLYDYASPGPGAMAFLVADVSGHGAVAAMLTGAVKSAFQSCAADRYAPGAVVERIAAGLRTFAANHFVTCFCGRLDEHGRLEFVNAGHPQGILWKRGEAPGRLGPTGPLISPALDGRWRSEEAAFPPGSRLLLCTDGVTEAAGEPEAFGIEGLEARVQAVPEGGAGLLDALHRAVVERSGGHRLRDDLTLLTVALE